MKILVVHPSPDLYGADLMLVRSVGAMLAAGHEVDLVVPEDGPLLERLRDIGVEPEIVDFPPLRKSLLAPSAIGGLAASAPGLVRRLRRHILDSGADVVYVNTITIPWWLAAARLARVPSVCHVREAETEISRALRSALCSLLLFANALVANSASTAALLAKSVPGVSKRTQVVYNGFDFPEPFAPPTFADRPIQLTLVGRISPRKGPDLAIGAVAKLVADGHDVHLNLVGSIFEGYEWFETELKELVARHALGERVTFAGYRSDTWEVYRAADIVLVPSLVEPFGNVAVEGLAASRPVVAARVGGLAEIITHGVTGTHVDPDDADALAAGIARVLADPSAAVAEAVVGSSQVRSRYSFDRYASDLIGVLQSTGAKS